VGAQNVVKAACQGASGALDVETKAVVPNHEGGLEWEFGIGLRGT
jgi:hypothetical protein